MDQKTFKEALKDDIRIIDVRTAEQFQEGHLEGAISLPLEELASRLDELDKSQTYHVICQRGIKSVEATALLEEHGFSVHNVDGGLNGMEEFRG